MDDSLNLKHRASKLTEILRQKELEQQAEKDRAAFEVTGMPIILSKVRSERHFMRYPLFACEQGKRTEPIEYFSQDGKRYVKVSGTSNYGLAKQRDADILRYALSKLGEATLITQGGITGTVSFTRYEVLTAIGKSDQKKDYEWLNAAIQRLASTTYETNIFSKDPNVEYKGPLCAFEVLKNPESGEVEGIAVHFTQPIVEAIRDRSLLAVDDQVLVESGGLRKRLLEIVTVHMGTSSEWKIGISELANLCAVSIPQWRFKQWIARSNLPYGVSYHKGRTDNVVTFKRSPAPLG